MYVDINNCTNLRNAIMKTENVKRHFTILRIKKTQDLRRLVTPPLSDLHVLSRTV